MNKIYKILKDLDLCHLSVEMKSKIGSYLKPKNEHIVLNLKAWAFIKYYVWSHFKGFQ